mmetsp:Transcript_122847/g.173071  ORF Transcript_122847/g.173071 Transcript_122847/m.173071 type:complete len:95 (-) Transcript_122847:16-300(-)
MSTGCMCLGNLASSCSALRATRLLPELEARATTAAAPSAADPPRSVEGEEGPCGAGAEASCAAGKDFDVTGATKATSMFRKTARRCLSLPALWP